MRLLRMFLLKKIRYLAHVFNLLLTIVCAVFKKSLIAGTHSTVALNLENNSSVQ